MKKIVLVSLALAALGIGPSIAADMPVKAPPRPAPPAWNWTGCYAGTNAGGAWVEKELTNTTFFDDILSYGKKQDDGYIAGVQVGCDYQFSSVVIGVRGMYEWAKIDYRHFFAPDGLGLYSDIKVKSFATAVGRLGITTFDSRMLLYVVGGWAWARDQFNVVRQADNFFVGSAKYNVDGWVIGGGFEFFLTPNLTVFAEYNHLDFGNNRECFTGPGFGRATGCFGDWIDVKQHVDVVMFGANYRLNWGAPSVVAKY